VIAPWAQLQHEGSDQPCNHERQSHHIWKELHAPIDGREQEKSPAEYATRHKNRSAWWSDKKRPGRRCNDGDGRQLHDKGKAADWRAAAAAAAFQQDKTRDRDQFGWRENATTGVALRTREQHGTSFRDANRHGAEEAANYRRDEEQDKNGNHQSERSVSLHRRTTRCTAPLRRCTASNS
jgi:hypothetical protein